MILPKPILPKSFVTSAGVQLIFFHFADRTLNKFWWWEHLDYPDCLESKPVVTEKRLLNCFFFLRLNHLHPNIGSTSLSNSRENFGKLSKLNLGNISNSATLKRVEFGKYSKNMCNMQVKCLNNLGHFTLYFVDIKWPIFQAQIFGMFSKSNFVQEIMATSVCNMRDMAPNLKIDLPLAQIEEISL